VKNTKNEKSPKVGEKVRGKEEKSAGAWREPEGAGGKA